MGDGDLSGAREAFSRASVFFDRADDRLSKPWTQPARLVPVLAQHRNSAVTLVDRAGSVSASVATLLNSVDYDSLRVVNGHIDLPALEALDAPLTELTDQIGDLGTTVRKAQSPWLVHPLSSRLDDLLGDIDRQQERGLNALDVVQHAPAMLGAEGPRVYFVAFTTPAEARGLGGFMGNWAEVTITDGRIQLTKFGRTTDLNTNGTRPRTLTGPADFLTNYGDFLMSDVDAGIAGPAVWSNVTSSPDFPAVAQAMAELYPQSGGGKLDGIFVMDVHTIARLMQISGPVHLEELNLDVSADNVVQFLMHDQYVLADVEATRVDALEAVAQTTVARLLTSALPSPPDLADLLGPMATQGRLSGWAARPEEEAMFKQMGMSGALPQRTSDGLAITFNNAGPNKIDDLLGGHASYDVQTDQSSGTATATLTITLTNTAPTSGLPDIIIGNAVEQPKGTNSTYLSVYSALPFSSATLDGEAYPFSFGSDDGYLLSNAFIDIAPGATVVVELQLEGGLDLSKGYALALRTPPTAHPFPIAVTSNGVVLSDGGTGESGITNLAG